MLNLNIAGYIISFVSSDDGPDLVPSERFSSCICNDTDSDIRIRVHSGKYFIPGKATKVFNAPYTEEINGSAIKKSDRFWSVYKFNNELFIETIFPLSPGNKKAKLKFSLNEREWDLWFSGEIIETDPMEYPLDGLILYYLTAIHGDIFIHGSGVNHSNAGYLFSGVSGKGKSTMARLWESSGARVIHDDRLILRKSGHGYIMHNTPVYVNDKPAESALNKIFIINHGTRNELVPVSGAGGVSLVIANCIQHNWDREIVARLLGSVSIMCSAIPVAKLSFRPDRSVIDHILEYA